MHPLAIIFYLVCGIAALIAFIRSKEKEKVEAVKHTEDLTKKAKELEKVKTMYFQFKDYLEDLFAYGPMEREELRSKLKRDFPYYKSELDDRDPLFYDLRYANIIRSIKSDSDMMYKGPVFTDIRLNFLNFLEFLETDPYGGHYQKTGFIDERFADEITRERSLPLDPKWKSANDPHKRYFLSISKGRNLNQWESNASLNLKDDRVYLICEFKVTAEYYNRTKHRQVVIAEPIDHDMTVTEYKRLFDRTYADFLKYSPVI